MPATGHDEDHDQREETRESRGLPKGVFEEVARDGGDEDHGRAIGLSRDERGDAERGRTDGLGVEEAE
ncbi:MAG: hypothetical protein ABEL76_17735, partial [Bradymonadaceae bacterium]